MSFSTIVTDGLKKSVSHKFLSFFQRVAAAALALFCFVLSVPAAPARANALTDWENNLEFKVTGAAGSGTYYPVSVELVTSRFELNGQNYQGYGTLVCVTYQIPVELTISGALQGAYNTGFGQVGLHIGSVGAPSGFAYYASQLSVATAYDKYGALGLGASFVPTGNYDGKFRMSFAPVLVSQAEVFTLGFSVTYKVFYESSSYDGVSLKSLWAGTVKPTISAQTSGCFYTYAEDKALNYGAQLKRVEQAIAQVQVGISNAQIALGTAISNQTGALNSNLNSNFATLTNTVITWGSAIDTQIQNFRQDILRYLEVDGDTDSINQNNNAMKKDVDNYHQKEDSMLDDAQLKLDAVDTTDFSALKTYQQATTFWTTAVKNTADGIGAFWFLFIFGCMIGLIAFILRFI